MFGLKFGMQGLSQGLVLEIMLGKGKERLRVRGR